MSVPGTYTKARVIGDIDAIWEEDPEHVLVHADGRITRAMIGIIPDDQFPKIKQGYACAQCLVIFDRSFPENCPACNFPVRERQTAYLDKAYVGNMKTGPTTTLEEEQLIMQEMREREARRSGIWTPPGRFV